MLGLIGDWLLPEYLEWPRCRLNTGGWWRLDTESWSLYTETLALVIADTELVSDW